MFQTVWLSHSRTLTFIGVGRIPLQGEGARKVHHSIPCLLCQRVGLTVPLPERRRSPLSIISMYSAYFAPPPPPSCLKRAVAPLAWLFHKGWAGASQFYGLSLHYKCVALKKPSLLSIYRYYVARLCASSSG